MDKLTQYDLDEMRENAAAVGSDYVSGAPVDHDARVLAGYCLELLDVLEAERAALAELELIARVLLGKKSISPTNAYILLKAWRKAAKLVAPEQLPQVRDAK